MDLFIETKYLIKKYLFEIDEHEGIESKYSFTDDLELARELLNDTACQDFVYSKLMEDCKKLGAGILRDINNIDCITQEGLQNQSKYTIDDVKKALKTGDSENNYEELSKIILYVQFHRQIFHACTEYLEERKDIEDIRNNEEVNSTIEEVIVETLNNCAENSSLCRHFGLSNDETDIDRITKKILGSYEMRYHVIPEVAFQSDYLLTRGSLVEEILYKKLLQIGADIIKNYLRDCSKEVVVELSDEEYDEGFEESLKLSNRLKETYKGAITLEELERRLNENTKKFLDKIFPEAVKEFPQQLFAVLCSIHPELETYADPFTVLPAETNEHLLGGVIFSNRFRQYRQKMLFPSEDYNFLEVYNCTEHDASSLLFDALKKVREEKEKRDRDIEFIELPDTLDYIEATLLQALNSGDYEEMLLAVIEFLCSKGKFYELCYSVFLSKIEENKELIIKSYIDTREIPDEDYDEGFEESIKKSKRRLFC